MPDSAVKRDSDARRRAAQTHQSQATRASVDTEKKLARAARSAQRLAQLSEGARGGATLDLFAEDAERAHVQAMNTDIRQGTFEGFELPDVFLAAVQSNGATASPGGNAADSAVAKRAARGSLASVEPAPGLFQDDLPNVDAPQPDERQSAVKTAAIAAAATRSANISTCVAPESASPSPAVLASALIASDRRDRRDRGERIAAEPLAKTSAPDAAAPELDRARATAFADTIDALYAVIAEQRTSAAAHARRMKTMLTIIVCVMLVTVATGIAQTAVLLRMSRDGKLQQDRTEQLMLNQQATLASLFDTDSATVSMHRDSADAAPVQPVSAAQPDSAPKKHARHAHHRATSSAH
ncbi:hypothetical protein NOV72_03442 [Caballeronia novacaledonica]|uniref:Cell wall surface anchor family protein n=1 Tax=Caballeronia novacaledonica TaxID=1544861 RepID=A0A2U3I7W6_9BURK|nr:hypothetical protein [Caballeronia novacaledonica]SPB16242.1 hypothetical protein NOV72_03442 [Caballeronia novacaledonica]